MNFKTHAPSPCRFAEDELEFALELECGVEVKGPHCANTGAFSDEILALDDPTDDSKPNELLLL